MKRSVDYCYYLLLQGAYLQAERRVKTWEAAPTDSWCKENCDPRKFADLEEVCKHKLQYTPYIIIVCSRFYYKVLYILHRWTPRYAFA